MGCDGGTIPTRDELVRTKKKPEQISKEDGLLVKWRHCAMSQEPLQSPIVACELGRIFNKESVINFLLDKSSVDSACRFDYIRSLKDVKELQLTSNPEFTSIAETEMSGSALKVAPYICSVTGLEMNGKYRFCYLLGCGCVFSQRALKEIKDWICVKCGKGYDPDDVIPLNGTEEDVAELVERMSQRRANAKKTKRSRASAAAGSEATSTAAGSEATSSAVGSEATSSAVGSEATSSAAGSEATTSVDDSSTSTSSLETTKHIGDDEPSAKIPKMTCETGSSSSGKLSSKLEKPGKFLTSGMGPGRKCDPFSSKSCKSSTGDLKKPKNIQADPNASAAYKSLFNTHETAKRQMKAHWVTHNPLYY